jgi:hypothetical protein
MEDDIIVLCTELTVAVSQQGRNFKVGGGGGGFWVKIMGGKKIKKKKKFEI